MGFRYYLVKIPKTEVDKVKNMTPSQLCDYGKSTCPEVYDKLYDKDSVDEFMCDLFFDEKFLYREYLYELGKIYFDDMIERVASQDSVLFNDKDVQEQYCDFEYFVIGKEGLLNIIEIYKEKIINYYNNLFIDDGEDSWNPRTSEQKIKDHFEHQCNHIRFSGFVNIDLDSDLVSDSWLYEHAIFNLVHILKTINWEEDTLLLEGH